MNLRSKDSTPRKRTVKTPILKIGEYYKVQWDSCYNSWDTKEGFLDKMDDIFIQLKLPAINGRYIYEIIPILKIGRVVIVDTNYIDQGSTWLRK